MRLTPGKARGLDRITDGNGRVAAVAIDQRPPLIDLTTERLASSQDEEDDESVRDAVAEIKGWLTEALAPQATGLLVDPVYGYCRALPRLPRETGLMLTLEDHRFETTAEGFRRSHLIPDWDVEAAVRAGAEALKVLVWYRPDAPAELRDHQQQLVHEVGEACRAHDRPFVLEILSYDHPDDDFERYARELPAHYRQCVEAFRDPAYGVDLYKLGLPARASGVREWGGSLYELDEVEATMREISGLLPAPWVLLSGGITAEQFEGALEAALNAGARGYLAGRAVWWQAMADYPDAETVQRVLHEACTAYLAGLNARIDELAPHRPEIDCRLGLDHAA